MGNPRLLSKALLHSLLLFWRKICEVSEVELFVFVQLSSQWLLKQHLFLLLLCEILQASDIVFSFFIGSFCFRGSHLRRLLRIFPVLLNSVSDFLLNCAIFRFDVGSIVSPCFSCNLLLGWFCLFGRTWLFLNWLGHFVFLIVISPLLFFWRSLDLLYFLVLFGRLYQVLLGWDLGLILHLHCCYCCWINFSASFLSPNSCYTDENKAYFQNGYHLK